MRQLLARVHARRFAVATAIAVALATLGVSVGQLYAHEYECIDYVCAADSDCLKVQGCDSCVATSGGTKRCATKVAEPY